MSAPRLTPAERREILRRHHPDLGGDPEEFVRVLQALARHDEAPPPGPRTAVTDRLGGGRWRRRGRRAAVRIRTALPRRLPGARRYGHL